MAPIGISLVFPNRWTACYQLQQARVTKSVLLFQMGQKAFAIIIKKVALFHTSPRQDLDFCHLWHFWMTSTFWKYHQLNSRGPQNSLKFESEITNLLVSQNKEFPKWWTVWVALSARLIFVSFVCFCPEWRWWLWILNHFHSIWICIQSTGNSRDYCEISRRNTIPFKI